MAKTRKRAIIEELLRREKLKYYQKHPLEWLEDKFEEDRRSFEWSAFKEAYENHKWDGDKDPIAQMWEAIAKGDGSWGALSAATGTSKTYYLSRLVFWFLDCFPDSLIVTSAPKETQLKLHLWAEIGRSFSKFQRIRPEAKLSSLRLSLSKIDEDNPYDGHQAVGFVAGVGADEASSTKAQGFHRDNMLIICEETPGMNGAIMTAFKNTCTGDGNNIIVAVGNPDNELDELAQFSELKRVKAFRISAYDYPNVVLKRNVFPGAVGQRSIDQRADEYGVDSPLYLSRVRGISPKESSSSLIKLSWIEACTNLKVKEDIYSYPAAGVDVANSENGDKGSVAYGIGCELVELIEFKCPSASDIAYNLLYSSDQLEEIRTDIEERGKYAVRNYLSAKDTNMSDKVLINDYPIPDLSMYGINPDLVGIDSVGVGASTVNTFVNLGFNVESLSGGAKQWEEAMVLDSETGVPMLKFTNLRAQMYWEAREDFSKGKVSIRIKENEDDIGISKEMLKQLKKELTSVRFEMRANAIGIEKKEKIIKRLGNSPNVADCFVYWNWMRKGYRTASVTGSALPFSSGS